MEHKEEEGERRKEGVMGGERVEGHSFFYSSSSDKKELCSLKTVFRHPLSRKVYL